MRTQPGGNETSFSLVATRWLKVSSTSSRPLTSAAGKLRQAEAPRCYLCRMARLESKQRFDPASDDFGMDDSVQGPIE